MPTTGVTLVLGCWEQALRQLRSVLRNPMSRSGLASLAMVSPLSLSATRTVVQRHLSQPATASASVSSDGRFVAFESLALGDVRADFDLFVVNLGKN